MVHFKAMCIFCGRTDNDVKFNREHIIPESLGGILFLDGVVCVDCNSKLGTLVDAEALKLPDVLEAFEKLNIPHDGGGILNRHYNVTGQFFGIELKYGKVKDNDFVFPPQRLPDGSLITPEKHYSSLLEKIVIRDKRLQSVGLSLQQIKDELVNLCSSYENARGGDVVDCPRLGIALRKHSEQLRIEVSPRGKANVKPLIAKIAYEMLFLCGGAELFSKENSELRQLLLDSIDTMETKRGIFVMRVEPSMADHAPVHLIRLEPRNGLTILRVVFFGHIEYVLTARPLSSGFVDSLKRMLQTDNLRAIVYQQQLDKPVRSFWTVNGDGEIKCIAASRPA
jgi:hypothetical protein